MNYRRLAAGLVILLFLIPLSLLAQPELPEVGITKKNGTCVLAWLNPYTSGVGSVRIERSNGDQFHFATIGYVNNLKSQQQIFIDTRPKLGKNWYKVVILFASGTEWGSNIVSITLDSAEIANRKPLPNNDSLQKLIERMQSIQPKSATEKVVEKATESPTYRKSQYVFTNPFNENIDINLSDALENRYALYFYNRKGKQVLFIPIINGKEVILDKRNFQQRGVLKFKLTKNGKKFETGYVTIY